MDLSKILSISGKPGLYKMISQAKNAVIVESLIDQKRFPAFGHEKISSLEEISLFTTGEDLPLKKVLKKIHDQLQENESIDPKSSPAILQKFFLEIVPEYDQERVYASDIRKILTWYNLLLKHQLLDFTEEEETKEEVEKEESKKEEKPQGKKAAKKG